MVETAIYLVLMIALTVYCYLKKCNTLGKLLLVLYTGIAAIAVYTVYSGLISVSKVTLLPYIFLIFSYLLYLGPFLKRRDPFKSSKFSIAVDERYVDEKYRVFLYVFIICSCIYYYNFLPYVIKLYTTGNWSMNYDSVVLIGGENIFRYGNRLEWLATQIMGYTSLLAIIICFMFLKEKKHLKLVLVTIVVYVLDHFIGAAYASSRGMIFTLALTVLSLYIFIYSELEKSTRRFIIIVTALIAIVVTTYLIDVTVSRFTQNAAVNSIIQYFGQPPIVFNYGIAPIEKLSWGKYTLGTLFGDSTINQSAVGGSWGSGFYTFVGWLYIDWGPIGVILIGILMNLIVTHYINRPHYDISDLYLIFYFYNFLVAGSLVIGPNQIISIIMALFLYVLIKLFIENPRFPVGKKLFQFLRNH